MFVRMSRRDNETSGRERAARRGLYGQRPSKSHDEACRKEFARIAAMSARERMIEALALDEEISGILGASRTDEGEPRGAE